MSNALKKEMRTLLWALIGKDLNDFLHLHKSTSIISKHQKINIFYFLYIFSGREKELKL